MADVWISAEECIDVTVKEFHDGMEESEKLEMLEMLKPKNTGTDELDSALFKLVGNRWRLTLEEEQAILKIANKIA